MEFTMRQYDREKQDDKSKPSRYEAALTRYGEDIDLSATFLPAKLVEDIFVKGIIDHMQIRSYINETPYFRDRDAEPAWQTVWHYTERTEEEFTKAYFEMEEQWLKRMFVEPGELLHVVGLRFLLSKMGILKKEPGTILCEGKKYVDDLYLAKTLKPIEGHQTDETLSWGAYAGLGLAESQTARTF
jgi:hypothetical protein